MNKESDQTSSVFLGATLNENTDNKNDGVHNITEVSDIDSLNDDGLECILKESVFEGDDDTNDNGQSPIADLLDNEK